MTTLPEPIVTLPNIASRYDKTDKTRSIIDDTASRAYDNGVAPLRKARAAFAQLANRYSLTHNPKDAQALGNYLEHWAKSDGLTGFSNHGNTPEDKNNHSTQQFNLSLTLSTLGMSYAQVRDALPDTQKTTIDTWLKKVDATLEEPEATKFKPNNHAYWRGAAHAAIGHATKDDALFTKGLNIARIGISQIDKDLLFPAETQRGSRSLDYQYFAAMPLVMTAELAATKNIPLYQENNAALRRVVEERLVPALENDLATYKLLNDRSGEKQLPPKQTNMPLFALYNNRFPSPRTEAAVNNYLAHLKSNPQTDVSEENTTITTGTNLTPTIRTLSYPALGGHIDMVYAHLHALPPTTEIHGGDRIAPPTIPPLTPSTPKGTNTWTR